MRVRLLAFFALLLFFTAGCNVYLTNGKYETSLPGRDDFVAVYNDLIIMRLRNPEKVSGTEDGYWDWGGRYEILSDDRIWLDMDRETRRQWSFYYELSKSGTGIKVHDLRAENSFQLDYIPPRPLPAQPAAAAEGAESIPASAYPAYK